MKSKSVWDKKADAKYDSLTLPELRELAALHQNEAAYLLELIAAREAREQMHNVRMRPAGNAFRVEATNEEIVHRMVKRLGADCLNCEMASGLPDRWFRTFSVIVFLTLKPGCTKNTIRRAYRGLTDYAANRVRVMG